jgi:tryptophan halogenase
LKVVVAGGGTAGYLAALTINKRLPHADITVIDSSRVGVLGAGEGTTTNFAYIFDELELPIDKFIEHTGSTLKNGIKFIGWSKRQDSYFHPLTNYVSDNGLTKEEQLELFKLASIEVMSNNNNLDDINKGLSATNKNKLSWPYIGWHLDAIKLAEFFKEESTKRGIKIIDDKIKHVGEFNGNITVIHCESGSYQCDFLIDATGFKNLFVGHHLQSEWVDTSESLPCTKALAFFLPQDENYSMCTEIIAMKYGWVWKTPLKHRYGCGYVYDPKYTSKENALEEIYTLFKKEDVKVVNHFDFKPGYYKTPWVKNCLSVGLAAGFFEPLHATSIMLTIYMLRLFTSPEFLTEYTLNNNETVIEKYNDLILQKNKELLGFIYIHYLTDKDNSEFWKNFKIENKMPEYAENVLRELDKDYISQYVISNTNKTFGYQSWMTTYVNTGQFNRSNLYSDLQTKQAYDKLYNEAKNFEGIDVKEYLSKHLTDITF